VGTLLGEVKTDGESKPDFFKRERNLKKDSKYYKERYRKIKY
jgi:hypothetical protein